MSKNYNIPINVDYLNNTDEVDGYDTVILEGLKKPKDRLFLLKLEKDFIEFLNNNNVQQLEFKDLNSYHRLFVHRLAVNYKLSHPSDHGSRSIILYKNVESSVPKLKFIDIKGPEVAETESPLTKGMMIMKRNTDNHKSFKPKLATKGRSSEDKKSALSLEEREAAYKLARARIFNNSQHSGTDSPPLQENMSMERDTDSEASFQYNISAKDDGSDDKKSNSSFEEKDVAYQRVRVKFFSQSKEDTTSTRINFESYNTSTQSESPSVNYFDDDCTIQTYENRYQPQNEQLTTTPPAVSSQGYSTNNYVHRREGQTNSPQNAKSIAETAGPYQQFQIHFQPGYNAPPIPNSYQTDFSRNYSSTQYGTYSTDPYYNAYGGGNYATNPNPSNQFTSHMGPDISFRPPPSNRQLFDHTKPSRSSQPSNSQRDVNKLTQSLNSLQMGSEPSSYTPQTKSPRLAHTLQVLPKSPAEPLRNVFIKGATIRRVPQERGYALLASFDSEEAAELAISAEANNPRSQIFLIRWEGDTPTPNSHQSSGGPSSPQITNRVNNNELSTMTSNTSVQAI